MQMIDYGLKDKVAVITGANNPQGIGATTALAFAQEGKRTSLSSISYWLVTQNRVQHST